MKGISFYLLVYTRLELAAGYSAGLNDLNLINACADIP